MHLTHLLTAAFGTSAKLFDSFESSPYGGYADGCLGSNMHRGDKPDQFKRSEDMALVRPGKERRRTFLSSLRN